MKPEAVRARLRGLLETSSEPLDPLEYARTRAEWFNRVPGTLTGWDCPKCLNRGQVMTVRDDGTSIVQECGCMTTRRSIRRLEASGLKNLVSSCRFEAFQTPEPWQAKAKQAAQEYAANPMGRWFLAAGNAGSGKTHLCVAICRELMLRGMDTRYLLWRDDGMQIKAAVREREEYAKLVEPLKTVSVLYIDDFFKCGRNEQPTTADVNLAFEVLNARYIRPDLLTIISTERTFPELLEIDQALGSRIFERSRTSNISMHGVEKNWRLRSDGA